jgi:hypothetical protein
LRSALCNTIPVSCHDAMRWVNPYFEQLTSGEGGIYYNL